MKNHNERVWNKVEVHKVTFKTNYTVSARALQSPRDKKRWSTIRDDRKYYWNTKKAVQLLFLVLAAKWSTAISEDFYGDENCFSAWNCVKMIKVDETDPVGGEWSVGKLFSSVETQNARRKEIKYPSRVNPTIAGNFSDFIKRLKKKMNAKKKLHILDGKTNFQSLNK